MCTKRESDHGISQLSAIVVILLISTIATSTLSYATQDSKFRVKIVSNHAYDITTRSTLPIAAIQLAEYMAAQDKAASSLHSETIEVYFEERLHRWDGSHNGTRTSFILNSEK